METYVERVHRLGHGRDAHLVSGETTPRTELTETLEPEPGLSPTNAHERLDEVLSAILCAGRRGGNAHALRRRRLDRPRPYLANPTESVTGSFDTPELEREREYADRANALVETDREVVEMRESSYLERLGGAVVAGDAAPPAPDADVRGSSASTTGATRSSAVGSPTASSDSAARSRWDEKCGGRATSGTSRRS